MKTIVSALVLAAGLACSVSGNAAANYSLVSPYGASLDLTTSDYVSANTTFSASQLTSCYTANGACDSVKFLMDATLDNTGTGSYEEIVLSTPEQVMYHFYFQQGTFQTSGVHESLYDYATLTVRAVPEPASLAMLGAGLPLVWVAARRRRRAQRA